MALTSPMFNEAELNQLYRYCYSLTVNETSAYDLLQTSLEKFLRSKTEKENNRAFIYKIIRNQFIDESRKKGRSPTEPFDESEHVDFDVKTLESIVIEDDLIEKLLNCLAPIEREILFYWAIEGYSTQQIAEMMAMPKGTVLSKIYRMRQHIKQQFDIESNEFYGEAKR